MVAPLTQIGLNVHCLLLGWPPSSHGRKHTAALRRKTPSLGVSAQTRRLADSTLTYHSGNSGEVQSVPTWTCALGWGTFLLPSLSSPPSLHPAACVLREWEEGKHLFPSLSVHTTHLECATGSRGRQGGASFLTSLSSSEVIS